MTPGATVLTRFCYLMVMEPGSLVMERKMLLGIKQRAERPSLSRGRPGDLATAVRGPTAVPAGSPAAEAGTEDF